MASPPAPTADARERRQLVWAAVAFFGALVVLIVVAALFSGDAGDARTDTSTTTIACAPGDATCLAAQQSASRPGIIPEPGEGRAPQSAGEPGGWGQIAVLVGIVVALVAIGLLVARSMRRSRRATAAASAPSGAEVSP